MIRRLDSTAPDFAADLDRLLATEPSGGAAVREAVTQIIARVRAEGDAAVLDCARRFDGEKAGSVAALEVPRADWEAARETLPAGQRAALEAGAARITAYARRQREESWEFSDEHGSRLGQRITPLDRVGVYVPGGKASYPSSLLMNAVPARVAGVGELVMVAPTPDGAINPWVLAAAHLVGVDQAFCIGGAQAVAAMAYGTQSIPAVDKIVGPGNAYVTAAKRHVFGAVGIDKLAGPSEILVICDGQTEVDWTVLDLFSQAEHDEGAQAVLVCPDADYLEAVRRRADEMAAEQPRESIIRRSLAARGALVLVDDLDQAAEVANRLAPEHLELSVADPDALLGQIRHAGAVFMGRHTPEAFGDYCAGPNHVLPTGRGARFSSPLGVHDFQKRTSLIKAGPQAAAALAPLAGHFADVEGLAAHAQSARVRGGQ